MKKQTQITFLAGVGVAAIVIAASVSGQKQPVPGTTGSGKKPGMGAKPNAMGQKPGTKTPKQAKTPKAPAPVAGKPGNGKDAVTLVRPTKVRSDPFYVSWGHKPPPPYVFNVIQPMRIASANVVIPPRTAVEVREVPSRRVSGIMSGDGVFAILEGAGEPEVVKPGETTRDGWKVVAINDDSVKLELKQGYITRVQTLALTDVSTSPQATTFAGGGGGGFPGGAGGRPGRVGGGGKGGGNQE